MNIVFEILIQPSGISPRNFLCADAGRAGSIRVTATYFSLDAKVVGIKASG